MLPNLAIRRAMASSLLAVSVVITGGLAFTPQSAQAAESSRVLYREYFAAGSYSGELMRAACTNQYTAGRYDVHRTEARVTWDAFNINGQSYNQLDCIGYTSLPYSPYRPARYTR